MAEEYLLARPLPVTIGAEDVDRLLSLKEGDAALLYLWLLKNGGRFDRDKAEKELKLATPVPTMLAQLRSVGLLRDDGAKLPSEPPVRRELPEPTAAEVRQVAEEDGRFRDLLAYTSELLGRVLSGGDMKILYGIYHDLGLPREVIVLMMNYCVEDVQRRYGMGRKPTVRQVEQEAYRWEREGLFDLDLAERWVRSRTLLDARVEQLCALLGIRGRKLAPSEDKFLKHWLDMGFGDEAVLLAYDRTVAKKGELAWNYMNRILENWHGKGLHTVAEIKEGDLPPGKKPEKAAAQAPGPTSEEFERMQKYLNKLNGGGDNGT